jgi:hypothetical protein
MVDSLEQKFTSVGRGGRQAAWGAHYGSVPVPVQAQRGKHSLIR